MPIQQRTSHIWTWVIAGCMVVLALISLATKGAPFEWMRTLGKSSVSLSMGPIISLFPSFRSSHSTDVQSLFQCQEEERRLREQISDLLQLKAENEALRQIVEFRKEKEIPHIIATLVSRHEKEGVNAVTIDRGSRDGIESGQAVVDATGALIGTIIETSISTATVLDIKDGGSLISATFATHDIPLGIAKGKKGASIAMELIPKEVLVKKDDIVITAGSEDHIPYGLFIGRIDRLEPRENDLFQRALVFSSGSLDNERFVLVLLE